MRILVVIMLTSLIGAGCHRKQPSAPAPEKKAPKTEKAAKTEKSSKPQTTGSKAKKIEEKKAAVKPAKPEQKPKSTLTLAVEGVTGKTAIDAGRKTEAKLKKISDKHNKELNEILGE